MAGEVNAVGTVPSARQLALDVLLRVLHGGYLAPALSAALDKADLEGHERSLATDLTYGVVRHLPQLDHALAPLLKAPEKLPPQVLGALRLGAYELLHRGTPRYAAVNAWVARQEPRAAPGRPGQRRAAPRRAP
ncbi:MAG: transcription antitermination factor NusB [Trueperaceae bacterium]